MRPLLAARPPSRESPPSGLAGVAGVECWEGVVVVAMVGAASDGVQSTRVIASMPAHELWTSSEYCAIVCQHTEFPPGALLNER